VKACQYERQSLLCWQDPCPIKPTLFWAISADLAKVKTKNIRSAQDIMMAERPADGAEHISGSFVAILPPMFRGMREHAERC